MDLPDHPFEEEREAHRVRLDDRADSERAEVRMCMCVDPVSPGRRHAIRFMAVSADSFTSNATCWGAIDWMN